jgi:hypothetical protein
VKIYRGTAKRWLQERKTIESGFVAGMSVVLCYFGTAFTVL